MLGSISVIKEIKDKDSLKWIIKKIQSEFSILAMADYLKQVTGHNTIVSEGHIIMTIQDVNGRYDTIKKIESVFILKKFIF